MKNILLALACLAFFSGFSQSKNHSFGFIENKGQIVDKKGRPNPEVKYLLNTNGLNVQLRKNGFSYDVYETTKNSLEGKQIDKLASNFRNGTSPDIGLKVNYHRVDIDFQNSNKTVQLIAQGKSADYDHYYNMEVAPNGILYVHRFQTVTRCEGCLRISSSRQKQEKSTYCPKMDYHNFKICIKDNKLYLQQA